MNKAGIIKTVGIHALRHSYATHLLEYGTDISLIQKLLGHNDIKTTLVYTNVANKQISNIESPLDKI
jgi:site-specific recombinase XerD